MASTGSGFSWLRIPLLVGGVFSYFQALDEASRPPAELSKPALRIEGFGTVPMPPDFDRLTLDQQNAMVDQIAVSLRPHWWIKFAEAWHPGAHCRVRE